MHFVDQARTCVILATGPSFRPEDAAAFAGYPIIAVNDTWRHAMSAQILYAADYEWWHHHIEAIRAAKFAGQLWTHTPRRKLREGLPFPEMHGLQLIPGDGLAIRRDQAKHGESSGHQAIGLAVNMGARRLILHGFDCRDIKGRRHYFGEHPHPLKNYCRWEDWVRAFTKMAADLKAAGIEVINCSPLTALKCWPVANVNEVINWRGAA